MSDELKAAVERKDYEELYHQVMDALRRSRMKHGDCKSGSRYGGVPRACSACMGNLKLDEALKMYKGRTVRIA